MRGSNMLPLSRERQIIPGTWPACELCRCDSTHAKAGIQSKRGSRHKDFSTRDRLPLSIPLPSVANVKERGVDRVEDIFNSVQRNYCFQHAMKPVRTVKICEAILPGKGFARCFLVL